MRISFVSYRTCFQIQINEVLVLLTQVAKRVSPLDNALFYEWKERIRKHSLLTEETLNTMMINE